MNLHGYNRKLHDFPVAQMVKILPQMKETQVWSLGWEDSLEKGMAQPTPVFSLENPMGRGALCATVHGTAKSWT